MAEERPPTPEEQVRRLYEDAETRTATAMERLVGREAFGEILAQVTENVLGMMKLGNDAADLVVRNLRIASRRDVANLARQLARTEDKLEQVLQEVERLGAGEKAPAPTRGNGSSPRTPRARPRP
jgi:hypothetical protein